jgi:hypothetical protein
MKRNTEIETMSDHQDAHAMRATIKMATTTESDPSTLPTAASSRFTEP